MLAMRLPDEAADEIVDVGGVEWLGSVAVGTSASFPCPSAIERLHGCANAGLPIPYATELVSSFREAALFSGGERLLCRDLWDERSWLLDSYEKRRGVVRRMANGTYVEDSTDGSIHRLRRNTNLNIGDVVDFLVSTTNPLETEEVRRKC